LPKPKKLRGQICPKTVSKGEIFKNEKRPDFLQKFVKITRLKVKIS
jgi:hypothetical protein